MFLVRAFVSCLAVGAFGKKSMLRKIAKSLARRAEKATQSNEKFNKRTAGAAEMSLPSEEESAQQKPKE